MVRLNVTQQAILEKLFEYYPNKMKRSVITSEFAGSDDFERELAYLVEKKYVKEFSIPSESKWGGRLEMFAAPPGGFTGRAYQISAQGIDLLRGNYVAIRAKPLTKNQLENSIPLPSAKKTCEHKNMKMVDIKSGSSTSVSGGVHIVKGERTKSEYLAFFLCEDCKTVFYTEPKKLES